MSIRSRQFVFAILTALFAVSAPLLILYATGYRYNIKKKLIEKTGALVLDSSPDNARILINGEDAHRLTPARWVRLLPDDYRVRMEKEGYHPWEKTLTVLSGHTTFATDVLFFRQSLPELISANEVDSVMGDLAKAETTISDKKGGFTYTLQRTKSATILLEAAEGQRGQPKEIAALDRGNYFFITSPDNLLTLLDPSLARLYVINPAIRDSIILQERATYGIWSLKNKKLLMTDDFELHLYDPGKNDIRFITRYGKQIKRVLWVDEAHIILEFNDSLVGMELDSRAERYAPILFSDHDIDDLILTKDALTAYFTAKTKEGRSWFKLPIQ